MVSQLRCPDHVGLVKVDVAGTGGKPQTVLAELVGGGRGHRHHRHGVAGGVFPWLDQGLEVLDRGADSARDIEQLIGHHRRAKGGKHDCGCGRAEGAAFQNVH